MTRSITIRLLFLTTSILVTIPSLFPQAPDTLWTRTFGGPGYDVARGIALMEDGGFLVAGTTKWDADKPNSVWVFKVDADGNMLWERNIGRQFFGQWGNSLKPTLDGGFVVAGTAMNDHGYSDVYIIKLDHEARSGWGYTFGNDFENTMGYDAVGTLDSGIFAVGRQTINKASSTVYQVKTFDTGIRMFTNIFDWGLHCEATAVSRTFDEGYIVTGSVRPGGMDLTVGIFLQKLNMFGLEEGFTLSTWSGDQYGNSVQQTADSGYIVAGYLWDISPYNKDLLLVRYDSWGNELWMKNYGHGRYTVNEAAYVEELPDGGFIVCGVTAKRSFDMWVLRTDSQGDTLWTKAIGDTYKEEYACQILALPDGGYIVAGERKIDSRNYDAYIVRLGPEGPISSAGSAPAPPPDFALYQNFPNPFSSETTISYQINEPGVVNVMVYNVLGQVVGTLVNEWRDAGYHTFQWNAGGITGGVYLYCMRVNGRQKIRRMIVQ
ncbi:MAG TPA: hypothetical protein DDW27_11645 [Bacteroidales bacterium]|nr:hypothetical protein [Bacteroidales bacterium]